MDRDMLNAVADQATVNEDRFDYVLANVQYRMLDAAMNGEHDCVITFSRNDIQIDAWTELLEWIMYSDFEYEIWPANDFYGKAVIKLKVKWGF